jgi:hypothetical protein
LVWTKYGDEYPFEARNLTDAEWRTHGEALIWSNDKYLDFLIPKEDLRRFTYSAGAPKAAKGLVAKGWWVDEGDSWYIGTVHPEWQLSAAEVKQLKAKAAARMKRIRRHKNGDHGLCSPASCEDAPAPGTAVRPNVRANAQENVRYSVPAMFADPDPTRPDP